MSDSSSSAERLRQRHDEITQEAEGLRAEDRLQEALHDLRASIIGAVQGASGTEAVRAELNRLFEGFLTGRMDQPWKAKLDADFAFSVIEDGYMIIPIPRPEAVALQPTEIVREDGTTYELELPAIRKAGLSANQKGERDQGRSDDHKGEVVEPLRPRLHRRAHVRRPCGRAPARAMQPRE